MSKDFKSITAVPTGSELVDIILSKTQRKTPTVVRPGLVELILKINGVVLRLSVFRLFTCER